MTRKISAVLFLAAVTATSAEAGILTLVRSFYRNIGAF